MRALLALCLALCPLAAHAAEDAPPDVWAAYLDYAYVYSSAEPEALRGRLAQYGQEAGMPLSDYVLRHLESASTDAGISAETRQRRLAIAQLLLYLAHGDPVALDASARAARKLEERLGRHENDYWYHYVLAHRALEKGHRFDFVGHVLDLWLEIVVPLETPYETLRTLSLSESPNSGFVSALPYVYENISRLVLIRAPRMGLDRDLDPLGSVVRLLADERVGAHPDVIPEAASSRAYLERIIHRLDGSESDAGSLTFTLALFEASKYHDRARSLLASDGLSAETIEAIRMASGAYATALDRADTAQGRCAVTVRALRQIGEVYAAKQRLGVDPEVETPFSIEGAIEVYATLFDARAEEDGWRDAGYGRNGRQAYLDAMHGLWEEIQETSLNAADYYLSRSLEAPHLADAYSRDAARIQARYLAFFRKYATAEGQEAVPDSAYFAAYEAARGFGDALIAYGRSAPTRTEMQLATRRYLAALRLFPFDRSLWSALTAALGRQGRENEYLGLVRPIAEVVTRSRALDQWLSRGEHGREGIEALRRALSESLVILHLGFAEAEGIGELEQALADLRARRDEVAAQLAQLTRERETLSAGRGDALPAAPAPPDVSAGPATGSAVQLVALDEKIVATSQEIAQLDRQIEARSRALPLYKAALRADGLADELRAQRDHPVHTLLRRMYHERPESET